MYDSENIIIASRSHLSLDLCSNFFTGVFSYSVNIPPVYTDFLYGVSIYSVSFYAVLSFHFHYCQLLILKINSLTQQYTKN